jgi:hypothetical protein
MEGTDRAREARDNVHDESDEAIRLAEAGQFGEALDAATGAMRAAAALKKALQEALIHAAGVA